MLHCLALDLMIETHVYHREGSIRVAGAAGAEVLLISLTNEVLKVFGGWLG